MTSGIVSTVHLIAAVFGSASMQLLMKAGRRQTHSGWQFTKGKERRHRIPRIRIFVDPKRGTRYYNSSTIPIQERERIRFVPRASCLILQLI
jgi:hypothetical protein